MAIGTLDIQLALEYAGFISGLKSAESAIDSLVGVVAKAGAVIGIGALFLQFGAQVKQGLSVAIDEVDRFQNLAQSLGTTANTGASLEALALGIETIGISAKGAEGVVSNFGKVMSDAFVGKSTPATRALKDMGLSVRDVGGAMKSETAFAQEFVNKMGDYASNADKAAVASKVLGGSAGDNASILAQTGTALTTAAAGATFAAEAFAGLHDRMKGFTDAASGIFTSILAGIATAINTVIDYFQAFGDAFAPVINQSNGLKDAFRLAWDLIVDAARGVGNAVLDMSGAVIGAISGIISVVNSLISAFGQLIAAAGAAGGAISAAFGAIGKGATGDFTGAAADLDNVQKKANEVAAAMGEAGSIVANALPKAFAAANESQKTFHDSFQARQDRLQVTITKTAGGVSSLAGAMDKLHKGGGASKGLTPDEKDMRDLERWTDRMLDSLDPTRRWMEETANLSDAFEKGLVSAEQFDQILAKINQQHPPDDWTKAVNDFQKGLQSFGDSAASSLADAIVSGDNLGDVFKDLTKQLVSMAIQTLLLKPLFESVFGGGVGGGTGIFGGLLSLIGGKSPEMPQITGQSFDNTAFLQSFRGAASGAGGGSSAAVRALSSASGGQSTIGSITMNITPDKTATIADSATGQRFGVEVTKLVQGLLVKESRPGGLLRRA